MEPNTGLEAESAHPLEGTAPVVTVFGSSRARPGDSEYVAARRLGQLLATRGWVLCNGGHEGTMEAAARGAKESGGSTIGVSVSFYRPPTPNRWLDREIVAETLFARLEKLVTFGQAYVVLHGGIGTLLEFSLTWNLVQTPEFAGRPIVLVGPEWADILRVYRSKLALRSWEADRVRLVGTVEEAVDYLSGYLASPPG